MSAEAPLIALAAGGTGGHMFPAEALASEMKRRGWRVMLFTDARGMRYAENFPADIVKTLPAANPNARGVQGKFQAGISLTGGLITALRTLRQYRPQIAVGFGGYPSAPAIMAAQLMKIPYGVHEQNAVLGRVNRLVAPSAAFVAHAFSRLDRLPACKGEVIELGNPVRDAVQAEAGASYPSTDGTLSVLVFGGSQGASLFSRVVPPAIAALPTDLRAQVSVTQQVREGELDEVSAIYADAGVAAELAPFFKDIPARMAAAHLVIARAGASSVTETAVIGRPSVLIPLGIAMDDHQTGNAEVLVNAGAAKLIPEPDLSAEILTAALAELLQRPHALSTMAAKAAAVAPEQATAKLADLVERVSAQAD